MAPPTPCRIRIPISHQAAAVPCSQVSESSTENRAKIANPRLNIRTRPNMSPSRPKLTTSTAVTTRYPMSSHSMAAGRTARSRPARWTARETPPRRTTSPGRRARGRCSAALEVPQHVVQQERVGELVGAAREDARPAVHHERGCPPPGRRGGGVHRLVVGREPGVHRVDLARHRPQGQLAPQLSVHRVVQVRVDVGDRLHPPGCPGAQWQQVLNRLDAGHLRAVLGHEQRDVDPFRGPGRTPAAPGRESLTSRRTPAIVAASPKPCAQSVHASFSVGSRATCRCTSMRRRPSIVIAAQ